MTTLRVILDEMLSGADEIQTTAEAVARELIAAAPPDCAVDGFVAAWPDRRYDEIVDRLPGLRTLHKSVLAHRELAVAWQHGLSGLPVRGMLHAPSLLAPLARHDRLNDGDQIVVTIHDTLAWTDPRIPGSRTASRQLAFAKRAQRYADAISVPSHAVAERLRTLVDFGDRVRVIPHGPSGAATLPSDANERAERLGLPERYALVQGTAALRDALPGLLAAAETQDLRLVVANVRDAAVGQLLATFQGVTVIDQQDDVDLAVVTSRAGVLLYPSAEVGFGMPVLDALQLGTPVVHTDVPALLELTADAAYVVERDGEGLGERLVAAARDVLDSEALADGLRVAGLDRAKAFTWRSAAEKIWQLHADL